MSNQITKPTRFIVEPQGEFFIVKCTQTNKFITKEIADKEIADEIADDFNAMENGDLATILAYQGNLDKN